MRTSIATLAAASLIMVLGTSVALAAPTQENVRIEGKSETLFEGPIWTEGHDVEASSDTEERPCDGTNNGAHATPGPTPTASSVDAMSIIGETFDGVWYGSSYDDYFITRWGPGEQNARAGAYWGLLVNNIFTNVGGCQYELGAENEVLWVYNAFGSRAFLALFPVQDDYSSGPRPLTVNAELGKPFEVEVLDYDDHAEDTPPAAPERSGAAPFEGAEVSPVSTSAEGFERVETASPATKVTNADGKASITFTEPGWHRIKATVVEGGEEDAVRSNRLDVCVSAEHKGCGKPPAEDEVRTPHAVEEVEGTEEEKEGESPPAPPIKVISKPEAKSEVLGYTAPSAAPQPTDSGETNANTASVQTPALNGQGLARGLVGVSWRVLDPGVGLKSWTIASRTLGPAHDSAYVTRATGTSATSALLALPAGALYELTFSVTDLLGRSSTATVGKVLVPFDDRWSGLHYREHWRRIKQSGAWLDTVHRGGEGAQVSARLGAGRPVFQLRGTSSAARVELDAGSHREEFAIASGSSSALRQITGADRSHAGTVTLRVLKGTVDLDGLAVEP